jgi:transcriptional regulator
MPMSAEPAGLVPGTLELLILKALSFGERHGYGVLLRLQQMTDGALLIEQGALYPALHRLERQGLVETEWGTSENNRRAKYYCLTAVGRTRLRQETDDWNRVVGIMAAALGMKPGSL